METLTSVNANTFLLIQRKEFRHEGTYRLRDLGGGIWNAVKPDLSFLPVCPCEFNQWEIVTEEPTIGDTIGEFMENMTKLVDKLTVDFAAFKEKQK